ncbi:MAG: prephenate dehydratase [Flavobacteriaceae bacterium]|nr:prephenate dehydratase [Flavobacteriaceae bacterium]
MKVAIQGIKGAFHHIVAEQYFGKNIDLVECMSFSEMPIRLENGEADVLIMAIENSIAGAILPNYALIDEYNLTISGEYYLPVQHHLMAIKGQKIEDIKEVYSHPMALLQCHQFFKQYPHIKLVEDKDTAFSAKRVAEKGEKGVGVIASSEASKIYDLPILFSDIQTIKDNYTRFFVLTNSKDKTSVSANKASIKFQVGHQAGSLAEVLTIFAEHQLNLSKIQSMPVIEMPWKYAFFADFTFSSYADYYDVMNKIKPKVEQLQILGEYQEMK